MTTSRPLDDGALTDSEAAALDELVFRFLEELDASGSDPERLLDDLCSAEPGRAGELRRAVERLRASGLMPTSSAAFPERIGDFRLERRLGAGGMGVVYLAEQVSLGRRVALKLVRPEQLYFQRTRARFRREVESAARLGHPGIAHVHTVGEEDGVPYFAQEYVPGASLDAVLRAVPEKSAAGLSGRDFARALASRLEAGEAADWARAFFQGSWETVCLRIVRAVAAALQHAHERGVLHRDVKPSNLILCPDGRVVLVDFGLANLADASALTRTGTQLGSLPYMAPEQVDGREGDVGPGSDVYALGVTLYELLTLRAPYGGESSERLRRQILDARPLAPRAHNPALSVDAETVCLHAMAPESQLRYPSAAAFAADLTNVLERRPPHARPTSTLRRTLRWAQRKPAEAAALVLGVVLLVGGPVGWGAVQASHAADMQRAAQRESDVSEMAERHFLTVLDTLDSMIRRFGEANLEELPGMTALRLEQIDRVLVTYSELERERPGDPRLCERHAWAHRMRGNTLFQLSRFMEAIDAYGAGLAVLAPVQDVEDERLSDRIWEQGALLSLRARSYAKHDRFDESIAECGLALERMSESLRLQPEHRSRVGDFATAVANLASSSRRRGDRHGCAEALQRARAWIAPWDTDEGLHRRQRLGHLNVLIEEARLARFDGDADEELALRLEIVERLDEELAQQPDDTGWLGILVPTLVEFGRLYALRDEPGEQARVLERATVEVRKLVERFPHRSVHRTDLLSALADSADLARRSGRFADARAGMLAVAQEWERRVVLEGRDESVRLSAAGAWLNAANVLAMSPDLGVERHAQALQCLGHAAEQLDATPDGPGETRRVVRRMLAYNRVLCLGQLDRVEEARASLAVLEEQDAESAAELRFLADAWNEWFLAVERRGAAGDIELAATGRARVLELLEESVAQGYRDLRELRTTPALDPLRTEPRFGALLASLEATRDD